MDLKKHSKRDLTYAITGKTKAEIELENAQKRNLEESTRELAHAPKRFHINLGITIIGVVISLIAIVTTQCADNKVEHIQKKQIQLETQMNLLYHKIDSVANKK